MSECISKSVSKNIQVLCVQCGSEIYTCSYGINIIVSQYGSLLCPKCRSGVQKLVSVQIREAKERLAEIHKQQVALEEEASLLRTRLKELGDG